MLKFIIRFIVIGIIILFIDRALSHVLKKGLIKYDTLDKQAEVLCIGSSYSESGIDSKRLELGLGVPVVKYIKFGTRTMQRLAMLHICLHEQKKLPKVVVYDVDPAIFEQDVIGEHPYIRYYPFMDVPDVGAFIRSSGATWDEFICRKYMLLLRYNDSPTIWRSVKGYLGSSDIVSNKVVNINNIRSRLAAKNSKEFNTNKQSQALEQIIELVTTSHDSILVFLFIPQTQVLNQTREENVGKAVNMFRMYESTNPKVIFLDYNNKYENRTDIFAYANHVNSTGQHLVTTDLIADLNKILGASR